MNECVSSEKNSRSSQPYFLEDLWYTCDLLWTKYKNTTRHVLSSPGCLHLFTAKQYYKCTV